MFIYLYLMLAGCGSEELLVPTPLEPTAMLRRYSLDIRGTSPTVEELKQIENSPLKLPSLLEEFQQDERFKDRLVALFGQRWLTLVDKFNLEYRTYGLSGSDEFKFHRSAGEEPMRLIAQVIFDGLPWTEVAHGDFMVGNDLLESIWPIELEDGDLEWRVGRYLDDRPGNGVLSSNALWWRYDTSPSNLNRRRAAAISRLLLCEDYFTRPVSFASPELLEEGGLENAVMTDDSCITCHSTMDPLASAMFGFWWFDRFDTIELSTYHAEREGLGEYYLGVAPAWSGVPITDPGKLGDFVAKDPRFRQCGIKTMAELFWQRPVKLEDLAVLQGIENQTSSGIALDMLNAVLAADSYLVGEQQDGVNDLNSRRLMSDSQLESAVYDLTGFVWESDGFRQMANDKIGYRVLAGGVDGLTVTNSLKDTSLPRELVIKRLAQQAALFVAENDLNGDGDNPMLFVHADSATTPQDPSFKKQLRYLHRRFHTRSATAQELESDTELWSAVTANDGPVAGWASVISVLIREPAFWIY